MRPTALKYILLTLLLAVAIGSRAQAQKALRGNVRTIRQGALVAVDSLALQRADSLAVASRDSLRKARLDSIIGLTTDIGIMTEAERDSLREVTAARLVRDSIAASSRDSVDAKGRKIRYKANGERRYPFISDSMSLSKVCWLSLPLPGFGQIYNKQYWKLGILYPVVGTSIGMFAHENGKYKPLKRQYDQYLIDNGYSRTPELDALQTEMIRHNTRRQIYAGVALATYIYFIGDAAINYATNDVSDIKKATTLSTICPGAGQIYNKSYWRVPIVIGGLASTIYTIDWNNRGYKRFKTAYALRVDYQNNPDKYPNGSPDEFRGAYSETFLKNLKNSYRRNRDLCILLTAGVYVLQIIDAHVDAHLKDYDISDDLSMEVTPYFDYTMIPSVGTRPTIGFSVNLNF
ncbi:MAG: hypothetical protein K2F95_02470 [Alistipes sp.]|nr:hypothetical protein [Alistipes sp.]